MSATREYEGYVKYPGGEVISAQCEEGRCDECPDDTPDGEECDGGGPLDGYYCEHGCGHGAPDPENVCRFCRYAIHQDDTDLWHADGMTSAGADAARYCASENSPDHLHSPAWN